LGSAKFFEVILGSATSKRLKNTVPEHRCTVVGNQGVSLRFFFNRVLGVVRKSGGSTFLPFLLFYCFLCDNVSDFTPPPPPLCASCVQSRAATQTSHISSSQTGRDGIGWEVVLIGGTEVRGPKPEFRGRHRDVIIGKDRKRELARSFAVGRVVNNLGGAKVLSKELHKVRLGKIRLG
jgi:hypothetical protein